MAKLNITKVGITIISRAGDEISLVEKPIEIDSSYSNGLEKRDLLRQELEKQGIYKNEHLCFDCSGYKECPKIKDKVKKNIIDQQAYEFIEMATQVYENEILDLIENVELDEAISFNVQKCKKYNKQ